MSQHDDTFFDKYLEGDTKLSELYKAASSGEPPASLDAKILAQARAAVESGAAPQVRPQRPRWLVPLSVAATVVLGINLALNFRDYQQDTVYTESTGMIREDSVRPVAKKDSATHDTASPAAGASSHTGEVALAPIALPAFKDDKPAQESASERAYDAVPQETREARELDRLGKQKLIKKADPTRAARRELGQALDSGVAITDNATDDRNFTFQDRANDTFAAPPPALSGTAGEEAKWERAEKELQDREQQVGARRLTERRARETTREALANAPATADSDATVKPRSQPPAAKSHAPPPAASIASPPPPPPAPAAPAVMVERKLPASPGSTDEGSMFSSIAPADSGNDAANPDSQPTIVIFAPEASDSPIEEIIASGSIANSVTGIQRNDDGPYTCNLEKLGITAADIDAARYVILDARPPLDARTWLAHIWKLADRQQYRDGCLHLTAYIEMYGPVSLPPDLPLTVPE